MKNITAYFVIGALVLALFLSAFFLTVFILNPSNRGFSFEPNESVNVEYCSLDLDSEEFLAFEVEAA